MRIDEAERAVGARVVYRTLCSPPAYGRIASVAGPFVFVAYDDDEQGYPRANRAGDVDLVGQP